MRINVAIPEANVKKPVLDAALEAVTRLNEDLIKSGVSPTADQLIDAGATWRPEKPGDEHFDHGGIIAERGHGDCDDWAPLKAAQLRVTGEDPLATAVVRKSGPKRWHAVVRRGDGSEDDPSSDAGMPGPAREIGTRGATLPLMFPRQRGMIHGVNGTEVGTYIGRPHLALRPIADRDGQVEAWQARADLPWHWGPGDSPADLAMVALHQSPVSDQAVCGAVRGAFRLGLSSGQVDPDHLKRMSAIAEACEGCPWEEIAERYGPDHATAAGQIVGSFWGKLKRGLKKVAMPLAKGALSFVPGGGLVSTAFDMASPMLKKSVKQLAHAPPNARPQIRQALRAQERQRIPTGAPGGGFGGGFGGFLPYPYPLPYPVPGWQTTAGSSARPRPVSIPGAAWPPRGA